MTLIDTHIALWLYAGLPERLPEHSRKVLGTGAVGIPPMAALELAYLHEVGRARDSAQTMLDALRRGIGAEIVDVSFAELTGAAAGIAWTRDPFDHLIAAHAIVADVPLVTADRTILDNLPLATWD